MVKTPKTRHSKTHREPVTIELEPGAVSRVEAAEGQPAAANQDAEAIAASIGDEALAAAESVQANPKAEAASAGRDYGFENMQPSERPNPEAQPRPASSDANAASAPKAAAGRQRTSGIGPGLAGGLIALLVAGGLQYAGLLGTPGAVAPAGDEELQAEVASLRSQIADLGAANASGDLSGTVAGLSATVEQVESEVEGLKSAAGQAGSADALAGLDARIKTVETQVGSLGQGGSAEAEIAALKEQIASLDAAVKSAGEAASAEDGKLAVLEQSVSALTSKVEAQASQPKIALAIAASALKAAVDRGGAFAAELETFAAISPNAPELATLRAYAEKGVATRADIVAETDAAANAMIAAAKPVNPDAGIMERLVASAESLVKVRPIGAVEGPGVPETVARMEMAVKQGDFAKALAEYETLPDPVKVAGADFAGKLKARQDVEAQVNQIVAGAMKA
ncbi:COG4223 family protein [Mesorhizobium sp. ANAO-SY3R2]|uniref:COG4223 family protein n=1 Tax=Mesorhizobium sp. ANAO-SY3R2 TaxID=3166644 RepID=UPI00367207C3